MWPFFFVDRCHSGIVVFVKLLNSTNVKMQYNICAATPASIILLGVALTLALAIGL